MTQDSASKISDQSSATEAFPYRVLLGPPTIRTIPIFAIQAEAGRPASEVWSVSTRDDSNTIDKQAAGRLRDGRFGDHRFVLTRHKSGVREVRYAPWLAFCDEGGAAAFLTEHPFYGLSNLLASAQRRIATLEHDLRQGLQKGRYNLAELDERARYHRANLYVTFTDELRRLEQVLAQLEELFDDEFLSLGRFI